MNRHSLVARLGFALLTLASGHLIAQSWQPVGPPSERASHGMAYDSARQRTVLFGGYCGGELSDTWELLGSQWAPQPTYGPPARRASPLIYDSIHLRTLLFGGLPLSNDTWLFDGQSWTQVSPTLTPPGRYGHAMTLDTMRGRVVMFGGIGTNGGLADTWEWDGATWAQRLPVASPPATAGHAMAYDASRHLTVLFGGTGTSADTWTWDGTGWTHLQLTTFPPGRDGHAMVYDTARACILMFGGISASSLMSDTWQWGIHGWLALNPSSSPPARTAHALIYDSSSQRVLLFGGLTTGGPSGPRALSDTWAWDGSNWLQLMPTGPESRESPGMCYDAGHQTTVMFGGLGISSGALSDTWIWDGSHYAQATPATSPPARWEHRMVYSGSQNRTMLFGGIDGARVLNDTWEWDGSSWLQRQPATSPPARSSFGMSYDVGTQRVLLFGGDGGPAGYYADTWEWNGNTWAMRSPAHQPNARAGLQLALDPNTQHPVLFGGQAPWPSNALLSDTWIWNGQDWNQQFPPASPPGMAYHAMAADSVRQRIIVTGGLTGDPLNNPNADVWEWDGRDWQLRVAAAEIAKRRYHAMCPDPLSGHPVVFGGIPYAMGVNSNTFIYQPSAESSATAVGSGCPGSFGVPVISASAPPLIGSPSFHVMLAYSSPTALSFLCISTAIGDPSGGVCTIYPQLPCMTEFGLLSSVGSTEWGIPIPFSGTLVGASFHCQAGVIDASGFLGVAALSAGLRLNIGD